jgi:cbb3-type cytochrome oxidase cytochrome c subunit
VARFRRADSTPAAIAAAGLLLLSPLLFAAAAQAQVQQQKPLTVLEGAARDTPCDTICSSML